MKCSSHYRSGPKKGKPCDHDAVEGGLCIIHNVTREIDEWTHLLKTAPTWAYKTMPSGVKKGRI